MNSGDVKVTVPVGCLLEHIVNGQKKLIEKYKDIEAKNLGREVHHYPLNLDKCQDQQHLKDLAWRVTEEIGEAMNCLKNKPWKNSQMLTDKEHYIEEVADALHFFVELCIASGLDTAEKIYEAYARKHAVNEFRQRTNY